MYRKWLIADKSEGNIAAYSLAVEIENGYYAGVQILVQ